MSTFSVCIYVSSGSNKNVECIILSLMRHLLLVYQLPLFLLVLHSLRCCIAQFLSVLPPPTIKWQNSVQQKSELHCPHGCMPAKATYFTRMTLKKQEPKTNKQHIKCCFMVVLVVKTLQGTFNQHGKNIINQFNIQTLSSVQDTAFQHWLI